jgi:DNA helicase-2/ATP-dependent DNA helicase PcrA
MLTSRADLEEERRLFYVAITRAEKRLTLSYATSRYQWGNLRSCEKSRFVDEIDTRFISFMAGDGGSVFEKVLKRKSNLIQPSPRKTVSTYTPPADFEASDTAGLQEGMRVEHPKFGFGVVAKMDTQGNSTKAIISFDEAGEKTLLLSFAKLKIHS